MFNRKLRVTFYMKSGNVIKRRYTKFEISKLSGTHGKRTMNTEGGSILTIDLNEIEAVTIK
tara:strand:+ start:1988 stop:2170 length:183 start_codon:yes stop_codon:yes gene_type:complete